MAGLQHEAAILFTQVKRSRQGADAIGEEPERALSQGDRLQLAPQLLTQPRETGLEPVVLLARFGEARQAGRHVIGLLGHRGQLVLRRDRDRLAEIAGAEASQPAREMAECLQHAATTPKRQQRHGQNARHRDRQPQPIGLQVRVAHLAEGARQLATVDAGRLFDQRCGGALLRLHARHGLQEVVAGLALDHAPRNVVRGLVVVLNRPP